MKKNNVDNNSRVSERIIKIIVTIITVIFILAILGMSLLLFEIIQDKTVGSEPTLYDLDRSLTAGQYENLYKDAVLLEAMYDINEIDDDRREYCYFAKYYNNAVLYHMYFTCNDKDNMDKAYNSLKSAEAQISHKYLKDKINNINKVYEIH